MPAAIDQLGSVLVLAYTGAAIWFDLHLLRDYRPPGWGVRLLQLALLLFPLELALVLAGQSQTALSLNTKIIFLQPLLALLLISLSRPANLGKAQPAVVSKRAMVMVFALFAAAFSTVALAFLGVIAFPQFLIYSVFLHGLLTGVVMVVVLQVKAWRTQAQQLQTQADLVLAEQRARQYQQQRLEQSQFLAMLAHELKTPLSVMRLVLGSDAPAPALLAHAKQAAQDMSHVIERCLQAERLADGQLTVQRTAVHLRDECLQLLRSSASAARLHLSMQTDITLQTDAALLRIMLTNLIENALKYSPQDSAIHILIAPDARQTGAGVIFDIKNQPGTAGWPDAAKVFQKYYRSSRAQHQTGSGLGLYLVHSMAHMLGGELRYAPDEKYIRFTLWLPV